MNHSRSTWAVSLLTLAAFGLLLGVPFLLRPPKARLENPLLLVVISPHDEGVKVEFERAFNEWHQARFGRAVKIEWPNLGGAGDIRRYVASQFAAEFRRVWGGKVPEKIDWLAVDRPTTAPESDAVRQARQKLAGLNINLDVYFGGGEPEHTAFKRNGWIVPAALPAGCDYLKVVRADFNGLPLYDKDHYWYGAVLTRVGIIANRAVCTQLDLPVPRTWADLADPRFRGQLALADPNFSGSAKLCYEMVLQKHGWAAGWPMLTRIAANARYFGSSSTQVALDVSRCDAVAGMIIDYYGRTQVDYVGRDPATGQFRLEYSSPPGATATTPDPIAVMRGAQHRELAVRFVQFVLSPEGQRLWMGKVGSPGGPKKFALYRPPIRPDVYETFAPHLIVQENPYAEPARFNMNAARTNKRFALLGVMMRAAFIDNAELLVRAADRAAAAGPDSPARKAFDEPRFPEGDFDKPGPGTMWALAERYNKATDVEKEKIAAELTGMFKEKYERVLEAGE